MKFIDVVFPFSVNTPVELGTNPVAVIFAALNNVGSDELIAALISATEIVLGALVPPRVVLRFVNDRPWNHVSVAVWSNDLFHEIVKFFLNDEVGFAGSCALATIVKLIDVVFPFSVNIPEAFGVKPEAVIVAADISPAFGVACVIAFLIAASEIVLGAEIPPRVD